MPRLSIIIPHRHDDAQLEATLLSALENRPDNSEIIVVHDGSYADPYQLQDEVRFVERSSKRGVWQLINAGVRDSEADQVAVVFDGVSLSAEWAEQPLSLLEHGDCVAVAVPHTLLGSQQVAFGISAQALTQGSELQRMHFETTRTSQVVAGPTFLCGFFDRGTLLALGGWNEEIHEALADVELAWLMHSLDLECEIATESSAMIAPSTQRKFSNASMKQLAELSVAIGASAAGTTAAMTDLLRGCLSGQVSLAVSWSSGIMSARLNDVIARRLGDAEKELSIEDAASIRMFEQPSVQQAIRRAA